MSTSARDALTPADWDWIINTDWEGRREVFDGDIWIPAGATRFINKTGEASVRGKTVQSTTGLIDESVELTDTLDDVNTTGVIYTAGAADGDPIAVFTQIGIKIEYLIEANDDSGNGQWIVAQNGGISKTVSDDRTGNCGTSIENKDDTVPFLLKGISGIFAETV